MLSKKKTLTAIMVVSLLLFTVYNLADKPTSQNSDLNSFEPKIVYHCYINQYRNGELISTSTHPLTITDYGKNWTKQLLANQSYTGMIYFACSNDSTAVSTSWTSLPGEITTNNLTRSAATYTDAGVGIWNMSFTWNPDGVNSTKLYGVYVLGTGNNLCLAEQQGTVNQKNLVATDTLQMIVQGTVS